MCICILQIQIAVTRIFQHARRAHQSQLLKEHTKTYDMNTIYEYVSARSVGEAQQENNKYLLLFLYFTPLSRQIQLENKGDTKEKPRKKTPCYALHFSAAFSPVSFCFLLLFMLLLILLFVALVIKFSLFSLALAISHRQRQHRVASQPSWIFSAFQEKLSAPLGKET